MKDETHENIDDEANKYELYDLEKLVLMKKKQVNMCSKANSDIYTI